MEVDYKKALKHFVLSARARHGFGYFYIAYMYEEGLLLQQDNKKMHEYYTKGSAKKHVQSISRLGLLYEYGVGVEQSYEKAMQYYKEAFELGDNPSAFNMVPFSYSRVVLLIIILYFSKGMIYYEGLGVEVDTKKGLELLEKAVESGVPESAVYLARIYSNKSPLNIQRAAELYVMGKESEQKCDSELMKVMEENKLEWSTFLHKYWLSTTVKEEGERAREFSLNDCVLTLLLVSKNRNKSANRLVSNVFVKGVTMSVIKYLCQFRQLIRKDGSTKTAEQLNKEQH